ncbi:MAG: hypothetical protein FD189_2073 [Elusimicrobia bacterium]|nr:MAG: hypothetical protein FD154_1776 [Elusimicrobiota bacterium]KAF0154123.1 MAG: hypothetical protein FD189_2073 [Elusimicrobiota bacterium]
MSLKSFFMDSPARLARLFFLLMAAVFAFSAARIFFVFPLEKIEAELSAVREEAAYAKQLKGNFKLEERKLEVFINLEGKDAIRNDPQKTELLKMLESSLYDALQAGARYNKLSLAVESFQRKAKRARLIAVPVNFIFYLCSILSAITFFLMTYASLVYLGGKGERGKKLFYTALFSSFAGIFAWSAVSYTGKDPLDWVGLSFFAVLVLLSLFIHKRFSSIPGMEKPRAGSFARGFWTIAPALAVMAAVWAGLVFADWADEEDAKLWILFLGAGFIAWAAKRLPERAERIFGNQGYDLKTAADLAAGVFAVFQILPFLLAFLSLSTFHTFSSSMPLAAVMLLTFVSFGLFVKLTNFNSRLGEAFGVTDGVKEINWGAFKFRRKIPFYGPYTETRKPAVLLAPVLHIVALSAFSALVMWGVNSVWQNRIEKLKAEIKAYGWPVSMAEFQENYPSGDYLLPNFDEMDSGTRAKGDYGLTKGLDMGFFLNNPHARASGTEKWNDKIRKESHKIAVLYEPLLLKNLYPALNTYRRHTQTNYVRASEDPFGWITPKIAGYIDISKLIRLIALDNAYAGKTSKAWEHLEKIFVSADLVSTDKTLIPKMVAVAQNKIAAETALAAMINDPSITLPEQINKKLLAVQDKHLVKTGMQAELAMVFDNYRLLFPVYMGYKTSRFKTDYLLTGGDSFIDKLFDKLGTRTLAWTGAINAGFHKNIQYFVESIETESLSDENFNSKIDNLPIWPYFVALQAIPRFANLYMKEAEVKTLSKMAVIFSAAAGYYKAHGRYPDNLSKLSPKPLAEAVLTDYFSGKPYYYEADADGKGFKLCSAGYKNDYKDSFGNEFCVKQRHY